ncbi:uncharacterized protein MYCFIDRAFT_78333 [Pseudocercospora fijiensis CIRAD86]|uniref:DNA-directed RNA polymerase subunit n=2 Tax=Pseudocercospora TaxID=131324 RepID=M3ANB6_PSEFD|nr:uncharacterized protein MYCFIDRAFT_78333 [Pseudocercospora fijiensis CIRAD86]EME78623.1 hypothetical protein MYCFIDRAFT_78333 [Pseudocercospora fijiensis CIRAD86]KAF7196691.1 DNA-directed RNA polymerase I subunit RPA12 [Pseudocercospora fuligena]
MAAIGSLVFCTDCGTLLDANTGRKEHIECDVCGTLNKDTSIKKVVTTSKPSAFPSTLRTRLRSDVQEISEGDMQTDAVIKQPCEKCGNEEVRFYTQQLRSADEGSTVFYTCPRCNHKWNTNN